jgi:hypothetical protein
MGRGGKMIWAFIFGLSAAEAGTVPSATVLVYNYAAVPDSKLADAEVFAARSFRAAGIDLTWVDCATSQDDTGRFSACEQADRSRRLFLRIVPERMAAGISRSGQSEDTLGIALVSHAFVLYERVQQIASEWRIPEYMILGRTIAHELGHLLLGENSHTARGLMRSHFDLLDLTLESAQFLFEPKQATRLREILTSR